MINLILWREPCVWIVIEQTRVILCMSVQSVSHILQSFLYTLSDLSQLMSLTGFENGRDVNLVPDSMSDYDCI